MSAPLGRLARCSLNCETPSGEFDVPYSALMTRRVVIHIGPPKTGSTTLQDALRDNRDDLKRAGIRYAGSGTQSSAAAMWATRRKDRTTGRQVPASAWKQLLKEINDSIESTVVVSSEWFAAATSAQIRTISQELPGAEYQIVIALRSLDRILPSRWRQNVIEGATYSFTEWLELIFSPNTNPYGTRFWHQHRHDELVQRWGEVFGQRAITAICVDDADPDRLLRHMESLIGAVEGALGTRRHVRNVSLDGVTVEGIRRFNVLAEEHGVPPELRYLAVTRGAVPQIEQHVQSDGSTAGRVPAQYADRCVAESTRIVEGLRASGATILGTLDALIVDRNRFEQVSQSASKDDERRSNILAHALSGQLRALGLISLKATDHEGYVPGVMDGFGSPRETTPQGQARHLVAAVRSARLGVRTLVLLALNLLGLGVRELLRKIAQRLRSRS